jgi:hypothetical protein
MLINSDAFGLASAARCVARPDPARAGAGSGPALNGRHYFDPTRDRARLCP